MFSELAFLDRDDFDDFGVLECACKTADTLIGELHDPFGDGEKGIIFATKHAFAGTHFGAALTNEDVADTSIFARVFFDAKTLTVGITAVRGRTTSFFMSHTERFRLFGA